MSSDLDDFLADYLEDEQFTEHCEDKENTLQSEYMRRISKVVSSEIFSETPRHSCILETEQRRINGDYKDAVPLKEVGNESILEDERCKLCGLGLESLMEELSRLDDWLICYGCGEAFHKKCLTGRLRRVRCQIPLIYRQRLSGDRKRPIFPHAPWYCNDCVGCALCQKTDASFWPSVNSSPKSFKCQLPKDSFLACRHCGHNVCLSCYHSEDFLEKLIADREECFDEPSNEFRNSELIRFNDLKNYSCPMCLKCVNCGLVAGAKSFRDNRIAPVDISDAVLEARRGAQPVILYADHSLCRPCYLSSQSCAACPQCQQIYHCLPSPHDFGEAPYDSDFSLCEMVACDSCGIWTHRECEDLAQDDYENLRYEDSAKFYCIKCRHSTSFVAGEDFDVSQLYGEDPEQTAEECKIDFQYVSKGAKRNVLVDENNGSLLFRYWSFKDPWRRQTYQLTVENGQFSLTAIGENFRKILASSLQLLAEKFYLRLLKAPLNLAAARFPLECFSALKPECLFRCSRLLLFLEETEGLGGLVQLLQNEMKQCEGMVSARTRPYSPNSEASSKKINQRRRILSKMSFRDSLTDAVEAQSSLISLNPQQVHSKFAIKMIYLQYMSAVHSDSSFKTINATSLGLVLRPSAIAGLGLFASRGFAKNSLVIEYCGEMLFGDEIVNRRDQLYAALGSKYRNSCYLFRLDDHRVLDATFKGNLSRFINHSCEPNCYSRVVNVDMNSNKATSKRLLIFASKSIEVGEEILYDYKFPDEDLKIPCNCGAKQCRKWMN